MVGILLSDKIRLSSNSLQKRLKKHKIDTRNFFMSMNEQPCFTKFKSKLKQLIAINFGIKDYIYRQATTLRLEKLNLYAKSFRKHNLKLLLYF